MDQQQNHRLEIDSSRGHPTYHKAKQATQFTNCDETKKILS